MSGDSTGWAFSSMRIAPGRSLPTSHAANWYGRRSSTRASARIPHPPTHRAREPQWWRCCAGSPSCVVDCAQFAACRLRLLRLRHTGMPRRPRPPIGPSPRHPIRDVSSGSTEGFKVLEQAGARSAWRYSGGSIQFHHSPTKRCNSVGGINRACGGINRACRSKRRSCTLFCNTNTLLCTTSFGHLRLRFFQGLR